MIPVQTTASGVSYQVDGAGVWRESVNGKVYERELIAFRPFVPVQRLKDDQGGVQYTMAWLNSAGAVEKLTLSAKQIASRTLMIAAFPDLVVTSQHATACIEYIAQCVRFNQGWLESRARVSATALGWPLTAADGGSVDVREELGLRGAVEGFTAGPGRPRAVQDVKNTGAWLSGHRRGGTVDGWARAVEKVKDRPLVQIMVAAALAAPLLRVTGSANFVVDLSGSTSGGKTIALSCAASVWGDPKEVLSSWKNTRVALEHHLSMLRGVPFFVDETQLAAVETVEELLYALTSGKSRGRSRQDGSALLDSSVWETVLLATGEQPMASMTNKGGLVPRIVALSGTPCASRDEANGLLEAVRTHHGHAGELFVREVGRLGGEVIRARFKIISDQLGKVADSPVAARRAQCVALLALAHEVAVGCGLMAQDALGEKDWDWLVNGGGSSVTEFEDDRSRAALREMLAWAGTNGQRFYGHASATFAPHAGWAGRWAEKEYVAFTPAVLKELLKKAGYDAPRVMLDWRDRGWLKQKGTVTTHPVRIDGSLIRHVVVTNLEDLGGLEDSEGPGEGATGSGGDPRREWLLGLEGFDGGNE